MIRAGTLLGSFGGAAPTPPETLSSNYSLEFAGSETTASGYVTLGQHASMDFEPDTDEFTISLWFKTPTLATQQILLAKARMNGGNVSVVLAVNTDGTIYALAGDAAVTTSGGSVSTDTWYMVTFTAKAGLCKLYLNTTQVGSTFGAGPEQNTADDWLIGASRYNNNTDSSYEFTGNICGVSFWSSAFSLASVTAMYNSGSPIDATTHASVASLLHWYPILAEEPNEDVPEGFADFPVVNDRAGGTDVDGTAKNTYGVRLSAVSPTYTSSGISNIPDVLHIGQDPAPLRFDATDYGGGSTWTASLGSWVATKVGSPVRQESSQFSGRYEVTVSGANWFRVADSTEHQLQFSAVTYVIRMKTGSLNGTGGFFFGYDRSGGDQHIDFKFYNFFYDKDFAARMNASGGDYVLGESHDSKHTNKYIMVHVVVDANTPRIAVYVNGGLLVESTTALTVPAAPSGISSPLGIGGIAYPTTGGTGSTAAGQTIMEVMKYPFGLTSEDIAIQCAEWNANKGY